MSIEDYIVELENAFRTNVETGLLDHGAWFRTLSLEAWSELSEDEVRYAGFEHKPGTSESITLDGFIVRNPEETEAGVEPEYRADFDLELLHLHTEASEDVASSRLGKDVLRRAMKHSQRFVEAAKTKHLDMFESGSPAYDLARHVRRESSRIRRVCVAVLSNAELTSQAMDRMREEVGGVEYVVDVYDRTRLFNKRQSSGTGLVHKLEKPIDAIRLEGDKGPTVFLVALPGTFLARLYREFGSKVLEGNVRSFLTHVNKVNKRIIRSIEDSPQDFHILNNGVTATATDVTIVDGKITEFKDFQIVNGGQTTASLAYSAFQKTPKLNLDDVVVVGKVIQVGEDDGDIVPRVAESSNSQTKVNDSSLTANSRFHREVEAVSRSLQGESYLHRGTYFYYERLVGQYRAELGRRRNSKIELKRFESANPKTQVIKRQELAEVEMLWANKPQAVSRGGEKNYLEWNRSETSRHDEGKILINENYWKEKVGRVLVWRAILKGVRDADWFRKQAAKNIAAYALSRFVSYCATPIQGVPREFDATKVWRLGEVPDDLVRFVMKIASSVQDVFEQIRSEIVAGELPGNTMLTEIAKTLVAHKRVEEITVDDWADSGNFVVDRRNEVGVAVNISMWAYELVASGKLNGVLLYPNARKILKKLELDVLEAAATGAMSVPSEKQSRVLKSAYEKLTKDGYSPLA